MFGYNLLQKLETGERRNLLISPASIELALGMAYTGASGKTAQAMSQTLGINSSSREAALKELAGLGAAMENPAPGVTLKLANAAWIDESVHLEEKFSADLAETFKTKVESVSFNDPATVSRINDWVSNATEGKINRLLEDPPRPPMFLANALYFHALWGSPFPKQSTEEQPFYPSDGTALKVKMMRQKARLPYARENGYAVVALPYVNDRFLMYCFLPDQGVDPLVEELKNSSWSDLSRALHPTEGSVALPKFKFAYGTGLQKELTELGLGIAFDAHRADFTRMVRGGPRFYIGSVIHKTFLEVDEEGSTAAAVTGIQMRATAMVRPREEFNLVFDRPFVAAIVDEKSGTSLFLGIVEKPES
ncbi:MAG: serpin family protein [Verrucomicrobia bacterium]|nr:serpin family protein [Verrucomicrobiota bacterium]